MLRNNQSRVKVTLSAPGEDTTVIRFPASSAGGFTIGLGAGHQSRVEAGYIPLATLPPAPTCSGGVFSAGDRRDIPCRIVGP